MYVALGGPLRKINDVERQSRVQGGNGRSDLNAVAEPSHRLGIDWKRVVFSQYTNHIDEAIEQLRKTLAIDSTFFYAHYNLGIALQLKGDLSAAIAEYEKAKQLSYDSFVLALLGAAKGLAGDKNAAEQALKELEQTAQSQGVDEYSRALLFLGMNNKEEALRSIEHAVAARDGSSLTWIKVDPQVDALRGDPRFEALVQKVLEPKSSP